MATFRYFFGVFSVFLTILLKTLIFDAIGRGLGRVLGGSGEGFGAVFGVSGSLLGAHLYRQHFGSSSYAHCSL